MQKMNTANKLTMVRVFLIPVFLLILYIGFPGSNYAAMAVFIVASITDFLDGYIARSREQVTDFGKFMDPLADKALVFSALLWFVEISIMPAWVVIIVLIREFMVIALRLVAVEEGRVIAAGLSGKVKTAVSMVCVVLLFIINNKIFAGICVALIVITTVYSGVEYFVRNRDVLNRDK